MVGYVGGGVVAATGRKIDVMDTSSLLEAKRRASTADEQAELAEFLDELTDSAELVTPEAVKDELGRAPWVDPQAVWAARSMDRTLYRTGVASRERKQVRKLLPNLADDTKPYGDADVDVLAMALRFQRCGFSVCVVTEDRRDRRSQSVVSACREVGIDVCSWHEFARSRGYAV